MTDFDTRLRTALTADDEAFLRELEDGRGLWKQLGATLQGPMRAWSAMVIVLSIIATGLGFWSIWQMFQAETTRLLILWAAAAWASWTVQVMLKQWLFDRMNTLTILREIKKLELKVAQLEARADGS